MVGEYKSCQRRSYAHIGYDLLRPCHSELPPATDPRVFRNPILREGIEYTESELLEIEKRNPEKAKRIRKHTQRYHERQILERYLNGVWLTILELRQAGLKLSLKPINKD